MFLVSQLCASGTYLLSVAAFRVDVNIFRSVSLTNSATGSDGDFRINHVYFSEMMLLACFICYLEDLG